VNINTPAEIKHPLLWCGDESGQMDEGHNQCK
jgi:hypothetical protein